jgi:ATP-dependent Lon protease
MTEDQSVQVLPVIPLDDAVILPGMSITLPVTSEEEAAALDAAGEGRVVLVPRIDGAFARFGALAEVEGEIALPGGLRGVSLRTLHRAELGTAEAGPPPLRLSVRALPDPEECGPRAGELARE